MEIKQVLLKTRAEYGKQCIFDTHGPQLDEEIKPNPDEMVNYIVKQECNLALQNTKQLALHEIQTIGAETKNSGMFHFEGGWPKEINPRDEEVTMRYRRRVEKSEEWAPKLRGLFERMEDTILQNGAVNIYQHYFDDIIPVEMVQPRGLRTVNVYEDPQMPARPVNHISWSPSAGDKMVVSYYSFDDTHQYNNIVYIWQIDNPNKPWMMLQAPYATLVSEFNLRDPSVLASGLISGQVCSWDIRTGITPVQTSHRQFSHRDCTRVVKWITTKSNTEFFSGSSDGRAMWWDTRNLRAPTEILVFDLQTPNDPQMEYAIGVSSADFEPSVSAKFMFGLENGVVISGSKKARTPAEKLAMRFNAHSGPVTAVDRSSFSPKVFLTVGDYTVRVWAEDAKDDNLASTRFLEMKPVSGCWNQTRHSLFYVITNTGELMVWDLLVGLFEPILQVKICKDRLTAIASHESGSLVAVGNFAGNIYLVESTEALYSFDKQDRIDLTSYLDRCSRYVKALEARKKEIKLKTLEQIVIEPSIDIPKDKKRKREREKKRKLDAQKEKEKSRVAVKRKPKEDILEFKAVEEKFFETVKMEKQKYEELESLIVTPKIRSIKKIKKLEKEPEIPEEEKIFRKPLVFPKRIIPVTTPEIVKEEKPPMEEEIKIVEAPLEKKVRRKRRKRRRKKKKPKRMVFKLPRPCKIGTCKPDVCCHRIASRKLATRYAKDHKEWLRERTKMLIEDKIKMKRQRLGSWMTLLHAYKSEKPITKCDKVKKISIIRQTTALHEDFTKDVKAAHRQIRAIARGNLIKETPIREELRRVKKSTASSAAAKKSRDVPRRAKRNQERDRTKEVTKRRVEARRVFAPRKVVKRRKVCLRRVCPREVIPVKRKELPCEPLWKPPPFKRDLRAILRDFLPTAEAISESEKSKMVYLKGIGTARQDYPR